jgi:spore maturation protein CgeB
VLYIEDEELIRMGENGRKKVFDLHNIDVEARKLLAILEHYINKTQ